MDLRQVIFRLSNDKLHAVDINDDEKIQEAKNKLYAIKRQNIQRAKAYIAPENSYKKYLKEHMDYIKSKVALNTSVKTTEEAVSLLVGKVDMRVLFGINGQYAEIFESEVFLKQEYCEGLENTREEAECAMSNIINSKDGFVNIDYSVEENIALKMWIYKVAIYKEKLNGYTLFDTATNKQLYFLKTNEDSNDYSYSTYYDLIELYEIISGTCANRYSAIKELCKLLNIINEYEIAQENKYENNLKLLQGDYLINNGYLILYNCLKYHIRLLEVINSEGREHINYSSNNYRGENIVSFSNEYIGSKAGISKKGTSNPKINLFCAFGLLIKIPFEKLPKWKRFKTIGYNKEENSYIIPTYTKEVLEEVERRIIKLSEAKIKPTKLSGEKCMETFGEEVYRSVYGNYYKIGA
ncbi:hypothetical protein LGK97_13945 [Clostridium sp. CS001]|uniref:hypothetical protein n=1 Tax=Clostridium sp. CS001 TaxID=2880648 RepID=UPI001CF3BFCB|nr:hypothetical protein [Clostridium sp. CS001]MCB2290844.1 hypothetical protein [Clostridium sp. CS001]